MSQQMDRNAIPHVYPWHLVLLESRESGGLAAIPLRAIMSEVSSRTSTWKRLQPLHTKKRLRCGFYCGNEGFTRHRMFFYLPWAACACHCRYISWLKSTVPPLERRWTIETTAMTSILKASQEKAADRDSSSSFWICGGSPSAPVSGLHF